MNCKWCIEIENCPMHDDIEKYSINLFKSIQKLLFEHLLATDIEIFRF